jgi:multidrug resistance efflux pump
MTDEELRAIRKRAEEQHVGRGPDWDDFDALLAEVERQRAELTAAVERAVKNVSVCAQELSELHAELEGVTAERDHYRLIVAQRGQAALWEALTQAPRVEIFPAPDQPE